MSSNQDPWTAQAQPTTAAESSAPTNEKLSQDWIQSWAKEVFLEQKRARRGRLLGIVLRGCFTLAVLSLVLGSGKNMFSSSKPSAAKHPHLAVVEVKGTIQDEGSASAAKVLKGVKQALAAENSQALVLKINSPGGSPVQAGQIFSHIQTLKQEYPHKPIYAVIEDLGASGGYYVAVAADQIWADPASMVGSIGVISGGFGFEKTIDYLGIERRVFTAGDNKAFLDPFSSMSEQQKTFWQEVLDSTHQQFIQRVQEGRGERLAPNPDIFSGLVWNGEQALKLGLIDELGSIYSLQAKLNLEHLVDYTPDSSPWQLLEKRLSNAFIGALTQLAAPSW